MARKQVLEIKCDRCGRVETQPILEGEDGSSKVALKLEHGGKVTEYEDLCTRCDQAIENYVKQIRKETDPQVDEKYKEPGKPPREAKPNGGGILGSLRR